MDTVASGYYDKGILKYGAVALDIKVPIFQNNLNMGVEGLSTMSVRTKLQESPIGIP